MGYLLLNRLASLIITLIFASIIVFAMLEVVPGDPAQLILGLNANEQSVLNLRQQMGLDEPLPTRYLNWVGGLLTGDLGVSYTYSVPVSDLVIERLKVSFPLALLALCLSTLIAIPVGIFAARYKGRVHDTMTMSISQIGIAIPNFWFALMLVYVFAVSLRWLPSGGFSGWEEGILKSLASLTLPAIALALPQAAILSRITRSSLIETMGEDYIRTARAKGLPRDMVLRKHALPNALIPVVTIMGLQFAFLLAGTIIIENVFYLPGLGRLVFQAITQRDLIVVESVVMVLVASVVLINFFIDLTYAWIDPRLRRAGS